MYRALIPNTRSQRFSSEDDDGESNPLMPAEEREAARVGGESPDGMADLKRELIGLPADSSLPVQDVRITTTQSSTPTSSVEELDEQSTQTKRISLYIGAIVVRTSLHRMHSEIGRLTGEQREMCKRTYERIQKHPIQFGLSIMIRLFSSHPTYKNIWPQFREVPDSSLMHSDVLRSHARVYMGGLKVIINSMEKDELLERALRGIAHAHVKWHIHKRHVINMLPGVLESFEAHSPLSAHEKEAWSTLFDVIANLIDIFRTQ